MRYPYLCTACNHHFDVIKSVKDIDNVEACEKCRSTDTKRYIAQTHFYGADGWDHQGFCPGLGTHIKSRSHRKQVIKAKGVEEIGSEPVEKLHTHFEKQREEKLQQRWDSV